jgi:hypothetical protein
MARLLAVRQGGMWAKPEYIHRKNEFIHIYIVQSTPYSGLFFYIKHHPHHLVDRGGMRRFFGGKEAKPYAHKTCKKKNSGTVRSRGSSQAQGAPFKEGALVKLPQLPWGVCREQCNVKTWFNHSNPRTQSCIPGPAG